MDAVFLYFIPDRAVFDASKLPEVSDHLDGLKCVVAQIQGAGGPNGKHGVIIAPYAEKKPDTRVGYYPKEQTWRNAGPYWLGWFNDAKPGPADLMRGAGFGANGLELADGNRWIFSPPSMLPKAFGLDSDGTIARIPSAKYRRQYEAAEWLLSWASSGAPAAHEEIIEKLGVCLSVHYMIGHREALLLELFNTENLQYAAFAAIGLEELAEASKKKLADTSAGNAGGEG